MKNIRIYINQFIDLGRKKEISNGILSLCKTEKGRLLVSCALIGFYYIVMLLSFHIVFFINDDTNIMYTVAGYYAKTPADHPFVNNVLANILNMLYSVMPTLPWYGLFHVFIILFSLIMIMKSLIKENIEKKNNIWIILAILCAILLFLFLFPTVLMQFTTTSALAGTASVILLLSHKSSDSKKVQICDLSLSVLLMAICYMHRKNSAYVLICFWLYTLAYKVFKLYIIKGTIYTYLKKVILLVLSLASVLITVTFVSLYNRSSEEWKFYKSYDTARFHMMDYPHDNRNENPELYKEIKWTDGLYSLSGGVTWSWFLMDRRINEETFTKIAETGYDSKEFSFSKVVGTFKNLWKNEVYARMSTLIIIAFVCLFVFMFGVLKKRRIDILYALGVLLAWGLATIYLCFKQRLPLRAYQVIIFPTILILTIMFIRIYDFHKLKHQTKNVLLVAYTFIMLIASCTLFPKASELSQSRYEKSQYTIRVEDYVMKHQDNIYVYDVSLTFRYLPFINYGDKVPYNLIFWGGVGWNSPSFFKQLEVNGLKELYSDVLLKENVYYVTRNSWHIDREGTRTYDVFVKYMKETFGEINIEKVEDLGDEICIYKFSK